MRGVIPFRFVLFAALSAIWLIALQMAGGLSVIRAAAVGWFITWGVQAAMSVTFWVHPFFLPRRYYIPRRARRLRRISRMLGLAQASRIAHRIHPFACNRRALLDLTEAITAAETTHIVTFGIVTIVAGAFALRGYWLTGACAAAWNVLCNLYPVALQRSTRARLHAASRFTAAASTRRNSGSPIRMAEPSRT